MLDLEVIPERSLGCSESWEFILGKDTKKRVFLCSLLCKTEKVNFCLVFSIVRNAFLSSSCNHPNPSGYHQERSSPVQ